MHKNTCQAIPYKKNFLFNDPLFILQSHFYFGFILEVEGILFFLMASCLNNKIQTK